MKKIYILVIILFCFNLVKSQCHYVIVTQDSWGDGWNGASVTVSVNGSAVATWELSSGSAGTDSLETKH